MVAVLPAAAVGALPMGDGSVDDALASVQAELARSDEELSAPAKPDNDGTVVIAVLLTVLLGAFMLWLAGRFVWSRGAAAARRRAGTPDAWLTSSVRPDDLSPALAGLVVGDTGEGRQSVVAATILDLIRRDVIAISGSDDRRFVLHVPAGTVGTTPFERAVLTSLRPINDPTAQTEVAGPPLWTLKASFVHRSLQAALLREARREGLTRANLPGRALVALAVAMGVIAIIGGIGFGWVAAVVGPVLAIAASLMSGVGLTRRGQFERDQWTPYAAFLRSRTDLDHAGAHAVHQYGEQLVYAAALGGASRLAASMSPLGDDLA